MPHAYLQAPQLAVLQNCRKIPYETRRIAVEQLQGTRKKGIQNLAAHGSGTLAVYRCEWCSGWHIGHQQTKGMRNGR